MQQIVDYILQAKDDSTGDKLLIEMTNAYIDYRNQIFDCSQVEGEILEEEDFHYVSEMDRRINEVVAYLED
jgi:hypothetical protein